MEICGGSKLDEKLSCYADEILRVRRAKLTAMKKEATKIATFLTKLMQNPPYFDSGMTLQQVVNASSKSSFRELSKHWSEYEAFSVDLVMKDLPKYRHIFSQYRD